MSTLVADIREALRTSVAIVLPGTYSELHFVYDIGQNNKRDLDKGYGVKALSASGAETVTKAYTFDHTFEIILTESSGRTLSDEDLQTALDDLYDKQDDILNSLYLTKVGLPQTVLLISNPSFDEVELISEGEFIALRMQIDIRYRRLIS